MTSFPFRPFQAEDVNAIRSQGRNARHVALWHEPGLGKSLMSIAVQEDRGYVGTSAAIICPAHLKLNWIAEWRAWKDDATCPLVMSYHEAMTTTYGAGSDLLIKHRGHITVDEAHMLKRKESQRAQAIIKVLHATESVIMLSGTPAPNGRPNELWTAASVLAWDRLRALGIKTYEQYCKRFCGGIPGQWNGTRVAELATLQACFAERAYRRYKSDCLPELPPKVYRVVPFARPPEVERENLLLVERVDSLLGDGSGTGWLETQTPETLLTMLSTSEGMGAYSNLLRLFAEAKARAAAEYIVGCLADGEKRLVVFGMHTALLETVGLACLEAGATVGWLHGGVPQSRREAAKLWFQDPANASKPMVMMCQYDAAGTGYTFTAATHCILLESPWTPGQEDQAADRLHRLGQLNSVLVDLLCVAGTLDEWRMRHVARKRDRVDLLTGRATVRAGGINLLGDLEP